MSTGNRRAPAPPITIARMIPEVKAGERGKEVTKESKSQAGSCDSLSLSPVSCTAADLQKYREKERQ